MVTINLLVDEIDPRKDMNAVKEALGPIDPINKTLVENLRIELSRVYVVMKPIIRGGTLGAGVGALASLITNSDINYCVVFGAYTGANMDAAQQASRMIYLAFFDKDFKII